MFDPNIARRGRARDVLPHYINDMITRMLAGVGPTGRPVFLKMVYHGPKAMEELVRFDPHLVVGILGGSAGTTRDAFQLLHDAQKYGAKVALFGRKINNAENQLAFVHFLRLIVEGQIGPVEAVKAYHAVLGRLGLRPHRSLDDDLKLTDQSMSYSDGARASVTVPKASGTGAVAARAAVSGRSPSPGPAAPAHGKAPCSCQSAQQADGPNGAAGHCCVPAARSSPNRTRCSHGTAAFLQRPPNSSQNGRPDFARMTPAERLAYHRERLGLGR